MDEKQINENQEKLPKRITEDGKIYELDEETQTYHRVDIEYPLTEDEIFKKLGTTKYCEMRYEFLKNMKDNSLYRLLVDLNLMLPELEKTEELGFDMFRKYKDIYKEKNPLKTPGSFEENYSRNLLADSFANEFVIKEIIESETSHITIW